MPAEFPGDRAQGLDDREILLDERHAAERIIAIAPTVASAPSHVAGPVLRDAAMAGAGAALLSHSLVGPDVAAGRLTCGGWLEGPPTELWALHTSRRLVSPKVMALVAHLATESATNGVHPSTTNGSVTAPASVMPVSDWLG
ncbi:LysR substrate-binding domain-containing protein [Methylobacterium sp. P1-11]|uniref:LysR substrate-binding domain-containing protein n=1 Tax=Methylobacterium sp. P1-11 TaxID=2024616 RepID=UPI001FEDAF9A|nr:LysR substrate-binding domain-containing protein [Methylobacterium sp. P1-11]